MRIIITLALLVNLSALRAQHIPVLDESWKITGPAQVPHQPGKQVDVVDHSFVKRADGKWMVWAAIRGGIPDHPFYGWEANQLTDTLWRDMGIVAMARPDLGEDTSKGIYAPHFIQKGNTFYCFFTSNGLRVMKSTDGLNYTRISDKRGNYEFVNNLIGRDVMIFEDQGKYYAFSCLSTFDRNGWHQGQVIVTFGKYQDDLLDWPYPEYSIVNQGGRGGNGHVSSESPFVVRYEGFYYLFRASSMTFKTYVYRSDNIFDFGTNTDSKLVAELPLKAPELIVESGQWYISDLDDFRGLRLYTFHWQPSK